MKNLIPKPDSRSSELSVCVVAGFSLFIEEDELAGVCPTAMCLGGLDNLPDLHKQKQTLFEQVNIKLYF